MKILLITDSYPPEIRSAAVLMSDFAKELKKRGHKIIVLTTFPRYNLASKENLKSAGLSRENGIEVIRVKTLPIHRVSKYVRGIGEISLPYFFWQKAKKIREKIDIVFVYSPPLSLGRLGVKLKNFFGAKLIVNIQDIFPYNAIDLGVMKNPLVIRFFKKMASRVYKSADFITVHSEGNKKILAEKEKLDPSKIKVIGNWADDELFEKAENRGEFRKKWGINSKFILLFAGVIGPAQGLENIVEVARLLVSQKDIVFLLVGDGSGKKQLLKKAEFLPNVIFQNFVSIQEYPWLVKEADVGLVCLSEKNRTPVVPGKIFGYMAAAIPILAILNKESDGHQIIKDSGCGFSFGPAEKDAFLKALLTLKNDKNLRKEIGQRGFDYFKNHFSKKICIDQYEKIFYD